MKSLIKSLLLLFIILFTGPVSEFYAGEKNAIYYNKEGWEHLKKGETFKAIYSFKNAVKKNQYFREAIVGLGSAYLETEAYEEALNLFDDALKLDKSDARAYRGKGLAMAGMGMYNESLKFFDKALTITADDLEARYGIAYIYYLMEKRIWAKRKLENILSINPYHYNSLLLMAEIKSGDNRLDDAKKYIEKAIDTNKDLPVGYVRYGKILLRQYLKSFNEDYLNETIYEFQKALSIQPDNYLANRFLGYISLLQGHYDRASAFFTNSLSANPGNLISLYSLALAYENMDNPDNALKYFSMAVENFPSDSLLQAKFEDHLFLKNYKMGHTARINFSRLHLETAKKKMEKRLPNQAIFHLRRSLLMNPLDKSARELLGEYYLSQDYYRFYVDELKTLLKMYPDDKYQDQLSVAVIKRARRLYHSAGYSTKKPPRDVPVVLVMDLWPIDGIPKYFDAGSVISNYLTFSMSQFGRLRVIGIKPRINVVNGLSTGDDFFENSLEKLGEMVKEGTLEKIDFVLYGEFNDGENFLSTDLKLMNFHNGVVVSNIHLTERGRENLSILSLRAAGKIFDAIPYKGRVLKIIDKDIYINLGSFDGLKEGDLFNIYKYESGEEEIKANFKKKVMLKVNKTDTLISSMSVIQDKYLEQIDTGDVVYPVKKRRARRIE